MPSKNFDRKTFLRNLSRRAKHFGNTELQGAFDAQLEILNDFDKTKDQVQKVNDLIARARAEREAKILNGPAMAELNALRVTTTENFLLGSSNAINFFTQVSLADTDQPHIENATRSEVSVQWLGQDGKVRKTQAGRQESGVTIPMKTLGTEEYEYQVMDVNTGRIADAALAVVDLAYDFMQGNDQWLWTLIKAAPGAFVTTGDKHKRTYNPHSSVATANLPTTNVLTPKDDAGNARDGDSVWDLAAFKSVLKYVAQWGNNGFRDGEMQAVSVFIPSSDLTDWIDQVDLDTRSNPVTDQIFSGGYVLNFGGQSLTLVGDNTLDPDDGVAYVQTNKPIGEFFTKPGMDKVIVNDGFDNQRLNKESIAMSKVVAAGMPHTAKVNMATVKYRDNS